MADLQNDIARAVTASNNLILARVNVRIVNGRGNVWWGGPLFLRLSGLFRF